MFGAANSASLKARLAYEDLTRLPVRAQERSLGQVSSILIALSHAAFSTDPDSSTSNSFSNDISSTEIVGLVRKQLRSAREVIGAF